MANTLRFKRGLVSGIPTAALGEPLFTTDTFDLYIGNGTGNTRFQKYIASGTTSQLLRGDGSLLTMPIVLTSPSNGQVLKYDGTNWVNSSDAGVTGSGAAGQVTFWNSASTITGSNNLFWDDANGRLGVGRTPSARRFEIQQATGSVAASIGLYSGGGSLRSIIGIESVSTDDLQIASATGLRFYSGSTLGNIVTNPTNERMRLHNTGNLHLGGTTDNGLRFQVTGDGYFSGSVGIGTSTPSYVLDLQNSNGSILARFKDTDSSHLGIVIAGDINAGWVGNNSLITGEGIYYQNSINGMRFYTNSVERMRLTSNGRLLLGSTTDNGLRFQVTGDGYFSGSVGIGSSALTGNSLRVTKALTGSTIVSGIYNDGQVQSDVTSSVRMYRSTLNIVDSVFTIPNAYHYSAEQGTIGASSTVTNQYGFITGDLTKGTNNYAFYGSVSAATGRWNLYMNGSAANFLNGKLLIGSTAFLDRINLKLLKNITGATTAYSIENGGTIQSDVTSAAYGISSSMSTQATAFTLNNMYHIAVAQGTIGAGSIVTNQYGFFVNSNMVGATNNYGFYGNIASGTGRWNLYMTGSASNFLNGNTGIGVATPLTLLHINGADPILLVKDTEVGAASANARLRLAESGAAGALGEYWDVHHTGLDLAFTRSDYGEVARFSTTGNLLVGTTTNSTFKLDVNGTMRVSGASTFGGNMLLAFNQNAATTFTISNTTSGTNSNSILILTNDAASGSAQLAKRSSTTTNYKILTTSNLQLYNGSTAGDIAILNDFASGAIKMAAGGSSTAQLTLNASGNLGLGVTSPTYKLDIQSASADIARFKRTVSGGGVIVRLENGNANNYDIFNDGVDVLRINYNSTERMRLFGATGNFAINTTTDAGYKLDVNGTMRVSGASTFARITATTSSIVLDYNSGILYHFGGSGNYYQYISGADYRIANRTATGSLIFATNDTNRLTIASTGAATFSSSVTAGGNLLLTSGTASSVGAINLIRTGTSPVASRLTFGTDGTGYSFAIGKNQGGTVTDLVTILDSGASTFVSSVRASGFNSSGGNGYQVINTASNTVTALRPTGGGTSVMSTNSNGLHIAVGTEANGDLILATNNTERIRLYRDGYLIHTTATNPASSSVDAYLQYSADVVAGNAAPHFRTENGAVIKLYQETTGVGNALFLQGGGNSVLDDSTFDGYTLRQIVKALRNQGILA